MVEISSPLGNKTIDAPEMRRFSVPDETEAPKQLSVDEMMALRRQKMAEASSVSDGARQRVEMLVGIGRAVKTVSVGDAKYSMRSLKSKEMKYLAQKTSEAAKSNVISSIYDGRTLALSMAIYAIDGIDIDIVLDCYGEPDRLASRMAFFDEMDDALLSYLYSQWEALVKENNEKYSIKSEADAKEVLASVKKSG